MENNPDSTPDLLMCTRNIKDNIQNITLTPDLELNSQLIQKNSLKNTLKRPNYFTKNATLKK